MNHQNDAKLIGKCRRGDDKAFAKIYDKYVVLIYRFINAKTPTREVADDLTQEVFLNLLQYVKSSETEIENLKAFLYQTARNTVASYYTSKGYTMESSVVDTEIADLDFKLEDEKIDLEKDIDKELTLEIVEQALKSLSNQAYRDIIFLRFIEELSHREISEIMEKDERAVRVQLHRAIKNLREVLNNLVKLNEQNK